MSPHESTTMPETAALDELTGRPHATVFDDPPRTVRLALAAGDSVPEHRHPGEWVLIHVVDGELTVRVDDDAHVLSGGDLLRFHGDEPVAPEAVTDAVALVTFAPDGGD